MNVGDRVEVVGPVNSGQLGMTGVVQSVRPFRNDRQRKIGEKPSRVPKEETVVVVTLDDPTDGPPIDKRLKTKNFFGSNLQKQG